MGMRLLSGRTFDARDRRDAAPVVVIDQALARAAFGAEDPVGRSITIAYGGQVPRQIVGIVSTARHEWPVLRCRSMAGFQLSTEADTMRRELAAMDALIPLRDVATLDDLAARSVTAPRFNTLLLGGFAAIALLLSASGIYSVMSYTVTQRTREIGVRMALGARAEQVRGSVWRRGLLLGLTGGAIGTGLAFVMAPQMATLLYEVDVHDLPSFVTPPLLFLVVAWAGSYLPARRASRVDPVEALRAD